MKNIRKHIIICAALFLISAALEWIVYLHYDSLTVRPIILNSRMAIAPVYNTDGSWLHGRLGIGYNGPLLWLENITALFAVWYLFRMMEGHNAFFGVSQNWLYAMDLEIVVLVYRLATRFCRPYTLDYLYIREYGTFDFPDFCIGAGSAGLLLWLIPSLFLYHRYKREQTAGMGFLEKVKWEFRMSGRILYIPFVRRCRWEERFIGWREIR